MPSRETSPQRVIIGLSGGVDSAVAAHLLIAQGYAVEGLFMKNWEEDDAPGWCAAAADLADAQAVAQRLGIQLHTVNFATEYWDRVFEHFLAEYRALRTPNPDVLCNREIKFRAFLDHALDLGAHWIATGHYARVTRDQTGSHLRLCADPGKDQTYFLHLLDQTQLSRSLFPLDAITKPEVRAIARRLGLGAPDGAAGDRVGHPVTIFRRCGAGHDGHDQPGDRWGVTIVGPETPQCAPMPFLALCAPLRKALWISHRFPPIICRLIVAGSPRRRVRLPEPA